MVKQFLNRINPNLPELKPNLMNEIVLAYIGDAVYELYVRCFTVTSGVSKVTQMHGLSVGYVKATSQAKALKKLEAELDEEEMGVVRRARNKKNLSGPKNVHPLDYKLATAFEALLGYLYSSDKIDRLEYIVLKSIEMES